MTRADRPEEVQTLFTARWQIGVARETAGFLAAIICFAFSSGCSNNWKSTIADLHFDQDGSICITQHPNNDMDMAPLILLSIHHEGKTIVSDQALGYSRKPIGNLQFGLVTAGRVVAVYEVSSPDELVVIYDYESDEYWPYKPNSRESAERLHDRGVRLVDRIRALTGHGSYKLSGWPVSFE